MRIQATEHWSAGGSSNEIDIGRDRIGVVGPRGGQGTRLVV